jgi:hypothetical protein
MVPTTLSKARLSEYPARNKPEVLAWHRVAAMFARIPCPSPSHSKRVVPAGSR